MATDGAVLKYSGGVALGKNVLGAKKHGVPAKKLAFLWGVGPAGFRALLGSRLAGAEVAPCYDR